MRLSCHRTGLFASLLPLSLLVSAIPQGIDLDYPRHPLVHPISDVPHYSPQKSRATAWTKLRDYLIESVWGPPTPEASSSNTNPHFGPASVPTSLLSRYGDDVVLRFTIEAEDQLRALAEAANILFLDIWASNDHWVDIRLAKDVVPSLLGLLPDTLQTAYIPVIHDLARTVYESYPNSSPPNPPAPGTGRSFSSSSHRSSEMRNLFFQDYQPVSVIVPWMRLMTSMFSSHVRLISVGKSFEGRDIPALKLGIHPTNSNEPPVKRKTIIISAGAHAREWISTSTASYIAYSLITGYGKSRPITKLLEKFDWVIIPTINPDGYIYTWETDRLWRKNRQNTTLPFCPGIDLDRSWGFAWDGDSESTENNPCSESFAGEGPFEATETRHISDWAKREVEENNVEFVGLLDLHSYSQQILYPYAYSCSAIPPALENLEELAAGLARSIRRSHGASYDISPACKGIVAADKQSQNKNSLLLEKTGGSALDWFYREMAVKYAYQIKLRDKGSYGFLLPRRHIVPAGKEIFRATLTFGRFLLGNSAFNLDWDAELQLFDDTETDDSHNHYYDSPSEPTFRTQDTETPDRINLPLDFDAEGESV
ncbi:putative metallocarboxypeptidase ecm14 [Myotisia sp. PD_48]|nr:putative metallocarboxypeptidase ecm14 [Myotisia sp. PD_48]